MDTEVACQKCTKITIAILFHHIDCLKKLSNKDTICTKNIFSNSKRRTPLYYACISNFVKGVEFLLEEENRYEKTITKNTNILHVMCYKGNKTIIELLLKYGYDVNKIENKHGDTPLHALLSTNDALVCASPQLQKDIGYLLLDYGADKTIKNNNGHTPLDNVSLQLNPLTIAYGIAKCIDKYEPLPEIKEPSVE